MVGCDEAGRGTWAGPIFVGAVALREEDIPWVGSLMEEGRLRDSKKMTPARRYKVYREMMENGVPYAVGDATAGEIDQHGIEKAFQMALHRAGEMLVALEIQAQRSPEQLYQKTALLIDGARYRNLRVEDSSLSQSSTFEIVAEDKLDDACATVALASIVAKVHQSITMLGMAKVFPQHGFEKHNGYPTAAHREAVDKHGLTIIHRQSWEVK